MDKVIWKYVFDLSNPTLRVRAYDQKVVLTSCDPATGKEAIWIEHRPADNGPERTYVIVGTGHAVPAGCPHVGSMIAPPFVWHVYDVTDEPF